MWQHGPAASQPRTLMRKQCAVGSCSCGTYDTAYGTASELRSHVYWNGRAGEGRNKAGGGEGGQCQEKEVLGKGKRA